MTYATFILKGSFYIDADNVPKFCDKTVCLEKKGERVTPITVEQQDRLERGRIYV